MPMNAEFEAQLRAIIREELARAGVPTERTRVWFDVQTGEPVTAEQVKAAMDRARDSVVAELNARKAA